MQEQIQAQQRKESLMTPTTAALLPLQKAAKQAELQALRERIIGRNEIERTPPKVTTQDILNRNIYYLMEPYRVRSFLIENWVIPDYQRKLVLPLAKQRYLILIMLYGYPIDPIRVVEKRTPEGATYFEIIDGSQRYRTIMNFLTNKIKTPSAAIIAKVAPQAALPPFGKETYFKDLPPDLRENFLAYQFYQITLKRGIDSEIERTLYQVAQISMPQTPGEIIRSFNVPVVDFAATYEDWAEAGWHQIYDLNHRFQEDLRSERLVAGIQMLSIESARERHYMIGLKRADLLLYASVRSYTRFTREVYQRFIHRFEAMKWAFNRVNITSRGFLTVMYQAVALLEDAGYDLITLPEGCLTRWFTELRWRRDNHSISPVSFMTRPENQRQFWTEQLPYLIYQYDGLPRLPQPVQMPLFIRLSGNDLPASYQPLLTEAQVYNEDEDEEDDED